MPFACHLISVQSKQPLRPVHPPTYPFRLRHGHGHHRTPLFTYEFRGASAPPPHPRPPHPSSRSRLPARGRCGGCGAPAGPQRLARRRGCHRRAGAGLRRHAGRRRQATRRARALGVLGRGPRGRRDGRARVRHEGVLHVQEQARRPGGAARREPRRAALLRQAHRALGRGRGPLRAHPQDGGQVWWSEHMLTQGVLSFPYLIESFPMHLLCSEASHLKPLIDFPGCIGIPKPKIASVLLSFLPIILSDIAGRRFPVQSSVLL